jgi:hypothetical protein
LIYRDLSLIIIVPSLLVLFESPFPLHLSSLLHLLILIAMGLLAESPSRRAVILALAALAAIWTTRIFFGLSLSNRLAPISHEVSMPQPL